jgi:hypothetical protein
MVQGFAQHNPKNGTMETNPHRHVVRESEMVDWPLPHSEGKQNLGVDHTGNFTGMAFGAYPSPVAVY